MFIWIFLTISLLAGASPKQTPCAKSFSDTQITKEQELFKKTGNPLFNLTKSSKDLVDFKNIKNEHLTEAMEFYIEKMLSQVKLIKELPANFYNTIVLLDSIREAGYVLRILEVLKLTRDVSDVEAKVFDMAIEAEQSIRSDSVVFKKIESVYKNKELQKSLSLEQMYLLKKIYKDFKDHHRLNSSQQKTLTKLEKKIKKLELKFEDNVLKEALEHKIFVDKKEDLKGVPKDTIKIMKQLAIDNGKPDKWLIAYSHYQTYSDVMSYAENRDLRQKVRKSALFFNYKGRYDNSKIIVEQIKLKNKIAKLYGHPDISSQALTDNMLNTPEKVFDFLHSVENKLQPLLLNHLETIKDFSKLDDFKRSDAKFYKRKYIEEKLKFNEKDMKPYFTYNNTLEGMFKLANKMFGLSFEDVTKENKHSQYHKDVTIYAVYDQDTHIGTLYIDPYTRKEKPQNSAAAMNILYSGTFNGEIAKPQVLFYSDFTKGSSFLEVREVETLFHEFGHALHFLLSNSKYYTNGSNHLELDALELPSMLIERLAFHPEVLSLYAKHHKTGKPIPQELVDKYKQKQSYSIFSQVLGLTDMSLLDMHIHTSNPNSLKDINKFEESIISKEGRDIENIIYGCKGQSVTSCSLTHIFSIGYSSKLYSYLWSEVMATDVYARFDKKGVFDKELNNKLKKFLQSGSSQPAEDLYKELMGRSVDVNHFIEKFD